MQYARGGSCFNTEDLNKSSGPGVVPGQPSVINDQVYEPCPIYQISTSSGVIAV